jgi:hypothetical protein
MSNDDPTTGSGRGGALGTPTGIPDEQPPSADQDANSAVSGGGMVSEDDASDAKDTAEQTGPGADMDDEDERADQMSAESFPGSDPPATWAGADDPPAQ